MRCVDGTPVSANSKARRAAALELELHAAHSCRDDDCDASSDSKVSDAAAGTKQSGRGKRAGASQGPKKRRRLHP